MIAKQNGDTLRNATEALDAVRGKITEKEYSALKQGLELAQDLAPTPDRNTDGRIAGAIMQDFLNNFSAHTEDFVRDVVFRWHRAVQLIFFKDVIRPDVFNYVVSYAPETPENQ